MKIELPLVMHFVDKEVHFISTLRQCSENLINNSNLITMIKNN